MAWSDNAKANALAVLQANKNDFEQTARQLNIPSRTLRHWRAGTGVNAETAISAEEKKLSLADQIEVLAYQLVNAAPDKIESANLVAVFTSLGIAVDKMRLLRDEPTSITESSHIDDAERVRRLAAIFDNARARASGLVIDVAPEVDVQRPQDTHESKTA